MEADFQEFYHVDIANLPNEVTARWFKVRVAGLFSTDSRIRRAFYSVEPPGGSR